MKSRPQPARRLRAAKAAASGGESTSEHERPSTPQALLLDMQSKAGNRAVGDFVQRLVAVQREPAPAKVTSPTGGVTFATTPADIGAIKVDLRGSLSYAKAEAKLGDPVPKKADAEAANQLRTALGPVKPTGTAEQGKGAKVDASLAGQPMSLTLTDKADLSQPFTVGGQLAVPTATLTFGGSSLTGSVTLDAFVHVAPKQGGSTTAGLDPEAISGFSFAGTAGTTTGPKATVGVATGTSMRAIDDLPQVVRSGVLKPLQTFDQRRWFLTSMRSWFGSDEATLAHFRDIVPSGLPGNVFVHKDVAERLAAVKAELGEDKMPAPENGFAFRDFFGPKTEINRGSMHTIGWAMDFDAVDMPRLGFGKTGAESATLIRLSTGQQPNMVHPVGDKRRALIKQMGEMSKLAEDDAKRKEFFAQKDVTDFFGSVDNESARLSSTSEKFKESLGANKAELLELRPKFFAATKAKADAAGARTKLVKSLGKDPKPEAVEKVAEADKRVKETSDELERITARVKELVKPWVALADAELKRLEERAVAAGLTLDAVPNDKELKAELSSLRDAAKAMKDMAERWKTAPPKNAKTAAGDQAKVDAWEKKFGASEGADVPTKLGGLHQAVAARIGRAESLQGVKVRFERTTSLKAALDDVSRILGTSMTPVADNLPFAQLVEKGFWNPKEPAKGKSGFNALFIKTMAKHGFDVGGNWEGATTDSMHFELVGSKG